MTPEEQIDGNIDLVLGLLDAIIEDPSLLNSIADGATVVNVPLDNPELGEANRRMAARYERQDSPLVIVSHKESAVAAGSHGFSIRPAVAS